MSIAGIENKIESKETVFDKNMVSFFYSLTSPYPHRYNAPIPLWV
jgi:hypothetical protein